LPGGAAVAGEREWVSVSGAWLSSLRVNNQPQLTSTREGNAIIDDRRSPRGIVTPAVAAVALDEPRGSGEARRRRRAVWYSRALFLRPSKVPRESHLRSRSWTLRTACRQAGHSTVPGCGTRPRGVRGSPVDRITEEKKKFCCVTTRRRNLWVFNGLGRSLGPLTALALGLGVLGFGLGVLAMFGLPPRCLPLADLAETFRLLAVALVPAPRLVGASAAFAHAAPWTRSAPSGRAVGLWFNVEGGPREDRSPKGKLGENVSAFSSGAFKSRTRQPSTSLSLGANKTKNKTNSAARLGRRQEHRDLLHGAL